MKKLYTFVCLCILGFSVKGQSYEVLNYNLNATPIHGVNIKTNLPFVLSKMMVSLKIEGYSFGSVETISLNIVFYPYQNQFYNASISSAGGYTPDVYLTNNNGFINVFIDDKVYYQRFKVTAFAHGISEQAIWFQGWTSADQPKQGTHIKKLEYLNRFKGTVINHGDLYSIGKVGIGTNDTKGYHLAVAGNMIAESVKVKLQGTWPDYVFKDSYELQTLDETEKHIKEKGHLPGIPSAAEVKASGIDLGEMNAKLLQKIEELTLHLIEQEKRIKELEKK